MSKAELTSIKHIGKKRAKILAGAGIKGIEDLRWIPEAHLAGIGNVGPHIAGKIKSDLDAKIRAGVFPKDEKFVPTPETVARIEKLIARVSLEKKCRKQLKKTRKRLEAADAKLRPLWRKKNTVHYIVYKKEAKSAKKRMSVVIRRMTELSDKRVNTVITEAENLTGRLKKLTKQPGKKQYQDIAGNVRAFNKAVKTALAGSAG